MGSAPTNDHETVDARSLLALRDLHAALGRFCGRAAEQLQRFRDESEHGVSLLETRFEHWKSEVSELREKLADASEDDDTEDLAQQLDEAKDQLRHVARWIDRVKERQADYSRQCEHAADLFGRHLPGAMAFLESKIQALVAYQAVRLVTSAEGARSGGVDKTVTVLRGTPQTDFPLRPEAFPLPAGFVWVPLNQINMLEPMALDPDRDFVQHKGYSYELMRGGLESLRTEILPAIAANAVGVRDRLHQVDTERGTMPPEGLANIYDYFFVSSEPIKLVRGKGATLYEIISGRHRLRVAMDLGWGAIPANACDLNGVNG